MKYRAWLVLLACACGRTGVVDDAEHDESLPDSSCEALLAREPDTELLKRWNAAVDQAQPLTRDFRWVDVANFPHPTFRRGDATAYREFSTALVTFWRAADTLEFVRCNALFDKAYLAGPQSARRSVNLRALTLELTTFGLVPAERQLELREICTRIGC